MTSLPNETGNVADSTVATPNSLPRTSRRSQLPHPMVGNEGQLANFLKQNIGKDLSKVAFPVAFNEPISLLQRQAEDMEYAALLDQAVATNDPICRIALVATFAISGYACTRYRPGRKPFNPVLGETFEDRRTNFIAEKVCHHPTVLACHAHGNGWEYWATSEATSSFTGNSLKLEVIGWNHVKMGGDHYRWDKPPSCVRNVILGQGKYLEHVGDMTVEEARTGLSVEIKFKEKSIWNRNGINTVEGTILSLDEDILGTLNGTWDEQITLSAHSSYRRLWHVNPYPRDASAFYGFTHFTVSLNEVTPHEVSNLPGTDSRRRPDQRLLEHGKLVEAEAEKQRIEDAQRDRQRRGAERRPRWFRRVNDGSDGEGQEWVYVGGYWEAKESARVDIGEPLW